MPMAATWPPWLVTSLRAKLDDLAALVQVPPKEPGAEEEVIWLSRFLVVRSTGFLEQVAVEVCRVYVAERSGGKVRTFAHSWLEKSRNPSPDNLEELIGRFDSDLSDEFKALLDDEDQRLRRELHFLIDRRNKIAHGLNEGVGSGKALALKDIAVEIADWFILRFNPAA
jgi:hypothetical protein